MIKLTEDVLRSMIVDNLLTDDDFKQIVDDYEKARILSKIDRYCTGKETVEVIELLKLGLSGRGE